MTTRHLTYLALSIATSCALSACKSTPAKPDVLTLPRPTVAAPVEDLILDPNPGVVARVRLSAWSELAPTLGAIARRAPDARLRGVSDALTSGGPLAALDAAGVDGVPDLSLVDRDRPAWLHVGAVAPAQTWGLLDLGVSLISPFQPISAWRVVALVPSSDPEQLAAQLASGPLEAQPAGAFVRVVWTQAVPALSGAQPGAAPATTPRARRMTPALARFLNEDAPAALYLRSRDARLLSAARDLSEASEAIQSAVDYVAQTPEPRPDDYFDPLRREMAADRLFVSARRLLFTARLFSLTPRSLAEFEDHAVALGGDAEAEAVFVDVVSTRTAFGREVQAAGASAGALALPSFVEATFPADRVAFDASFGFDAAAVEALYDASALTAMSDGDEPATFGAGVDAHLRELDEPVHGLPVLAHSPSFLGALFLRSGPAPRLLGGARPLAGRVRVRSVEGAFPLGFAAAVALTGDLGALERTLERVEDEVVSTMGAPITFEWNPSERGAVLTVAFNLPGDAFGDPAPLPAGGVQATYDAAPLASHVPDALGLATIGALRLQAIPGAAASDVRLSLSPRPTPARPTPAYVFDPAPTSHPCVDRIHAAAVTVEDTMSKVTPENRPEVFGPLAAAIDACAAKVESPLWALARSRASWFPVTYGTDHDAMVTAYAEACEAGDELGCAGEAYLEAVEGGAK